jgi:hypothetical protein
MRIVVVGIEKGADSLLYLALSSSTPTHGRSPSHAKQKRATSAGPGNHAAGGNIMERPLPRPQTQQQGRQQEYHQQLATH